MGPQLKIAILLMFIITSTHAKCLNQTFKVSMAQMKESVTYNEVTKSFQGPYVDMLKLIEKNSALRFEISVYPFSRSLKNIIDESADIHIPLIKNPTSTNKKYQLSSFTLFTVPFVLYTLRSKNISADNVAGLKIRTDSAHTSFFPFKTIPSHCIECSLKMVNIGRIDGYIFAQVEADHFLKKDGIQNIQRQLYKEFEVKMVFSNSKKGNKTKKCVTEAISKVIKSPLFKKTIKKLISPYDDWQTN